MKTKLLPLFITLLMTLLCGNLFAQNYKLVFEVENVQNPGEELLLLTDDQPRKITVTINDGTNSKAEITDKMGVKWDAPNGDIKTLSSGFSIIWSPKKDGVTDKVSFKYIGGAKINEETKKINISGTINIISPVSYNKHYKNEKVLGYEVGEYLIPRKKDNKNKVNATSTWPDIYPEKFQPPAYFYIVTNENKNLKISKHYKFGDYALDYPWYSMGIPQAMALEYGLFSKLEELQEMMNKDGYKFEKFEILYGWRAPAFNLGTIAEDGANTLKAPYSQHQYGRAIDILIDTDGDLVIDDLNKDGKTDMHDPEVIMHYVNILDRKYRDEKDPRMGGAGLYSHHDFKGRKQSPYIHIDTRNFTGSEGYLIRWPNTYPDGTTIQFGKI